MGTNLTWRCDGCGEVRAMRTIDEWRVVQLIINGAKGPPLVSANYELCPTCQMRLLEAVKPQSWRLPKMRVQMRPRVMAMNGGNE